MAYQVGNGRLKFLDLDRLSQMLGEASGAAVLNVFLHSEAADGNARKSVPVVQFPHDVSTVAIGQAQIADDKVEFFSSFSPRFPGCIQGCAHALSRGDIAPGPL